MRATGTLTVTVPFWYEELTKVPLKRAVAFLQLPHEIENLHGFWKLIPSCEHPDEETIAFRGETPIPGAETTTLPGGRTVTIVIAGAGCDGGVGTRPVPVSGRESGLDCESLTIVIAAVLLPAVCGEKTTDSVQVPLAASVSGGIGQSLLTENSEALAPDGAMLVIVKTPVPVLVSVTNDGGLEVPSS